MDGLFAFDTQLFSAIVTAVANNGLLAGSRSRWPTSTSTDWSGGSPASWSLARAAWGRRGIWGALTVYLGLVDGWLVAELLKLVVRRPRPFSVVLDLPPTLITEPSCFSFPSGDAAFALARRWRWVVSLPPGACPRCCSPSPSPSSGSLSASITRSTSSPEHPSVRSRALPRRFAVRCCGAACAGARSWSRTRTGTASGTSTSRVIARGSCRWCRGSSTSSSATAAFQVVHVRRPHHLGRGLSREASGRPAAHRGTGTRGAPGSSVPGTCSPTTSSFRESPCSGTSRRDCAFPRPSDARCASATSQIRSAIPRRLRSCCAASGWAPYVFSRGVGDEGERVGAEFRWQGPSGDSVLATHLVDHYSGGLQLVGDIAETPPGLRARSRGRARAPVRRQPLVREPRIAALQFVGDDPSSMRTRGCPRLLRP